MTAAPNPNLKTSKHLDNSGASCNSKLQTFQNLFNYLITVANSQKLKTRGQAVALAANQNNNSEIPGLFCLQLQIKNPRHSLRLAASKRPRTSKRAVDFFSIEKVFFQHQGLFQHPKGVFSAPGVFSASTVFYQHLRCFSSTRKRVFLQHQKGVF